MYLVKVQAMVEWPQPKIVTDIRSFLWFIGYYSRLIKHFSLVALPMTKLMRKRIKFLWDDKCELSFQSLKNSLTNAHVLTLPNGDEDFV